MFAENIAWENLQTCKKNHFSVGTMAKIYFLFNSARILTILKWNAAKIDENFFYKNQNWTNIALISV